MPFQPGSPPEPKMRGHDRRDDKTGAV